MQPECPNIHGSRKWLRGETKVSERADCEGYEEKLPRFFGNRIQRGNQEFQRRVSGGGVQTLGEGLWEAGARLFRPFTFAGWRFG